MSKKTFNLTIDKPLAPGGISSEWFSSSDQTEREAAFGARQILSELGKPGPLSEDDLIDYLSRNFNDIHIFLPLLSFQKDDIKKIFSGQIGSNALLSEDEELARKLAEEEKREIEAEKKRLEQENKIYALKLQEEENIRNELLQKQKEDDEALIHKILEQEEEATRRAEEELTAKLAAEQEKERKEEEERQKRLKAQFDEDEEYAKLIEAQKQNTEKQLEDDIELANLIAKQELSEKSNLRPVSPITVVSPAVPSVNFEDILRELKNEGFFNLEEMQKLSKSALEALSNYILTDNEISHETMSLAIDVIGDLINPANE